MKPGVFNCCFFVSKMLNVTYEHRSANITKFSGGTYNPGPSLREYRGTLGGRRVIVAEGTEMNMGSSKN
jgi:hypothetical protein